MQILILLTEDIVLLLDCSPSSLIPSLMRVPSRRRIVRTTALELFTILSLSVEMPVLLSTHTLCAQVLRHKCRD